MHRWTVQLPRGVREPFEVYVNGVPQREGTDFERRGDRLLFDRPLAKEGRLGAWRWFLGASGSEAPQIWVKRLIWSTLVTGMIPGTIGTSMPAARASSTNSKYRRLSKNSWVMRKLAPASTFSRRKRRSACRSAASGCTSGNAAAPMASSG